MQLTKFVCDEIDLATSRVIQSSYKILGQSWNPTSDEFVLQSKLIYARHPTKRRILQQVHATFDPLGLLIPLFTPAKIFLQELWRKEYDWDTPLSTKRVPRELSSPKFTIEHTLQTFVDASSHSIAACVYLRSRTSEGRFYSNLIIARHRLTPAKQLNSNPEITIPKLELVALQIGMQLTKFICDEIDLAISRVIVHSDSQIALGWVHSEKSKGVFIQNRNIESAIHTLLP
ncbi:Pao retrotransposon peptidase [Ostertagia ostertagi]